MSLEDFWIKYNVETKNKTKNKSFKPKPDNFEDLNTGRFLNAAEQFQPKLDTNIFHIMSVEIVVAKVKFYIAKNKLVALSLRGFSSYIHILAPKMYN